MGINSWSLNRRLKKNIPESLSSKFTIKNFRSRFPPFLRKLQVFIDDLKFRLETCPSKVHTPLSNTSPEGSFARIGIDVKLKTEEMTLSKLTQKNEEKVAVTPELTAFIQEWKDKPGNLIMVLHRVQETYGYIPRSVAFETASMLDIPLAKIYGVVTFYNYFRQEKTGKYNIQVCMGTACYLRGGEDLILELERELGVGVNVKTPDGLFSVEPVRCLGCCGLAPVMVVNGEVHGKLKTNQIKGILDHYREQA